MWERGLKYKNIKVLTQDMSVAPHVGAWIEIPLSGEGINLPRLSLPMWDPWIEIFIPPYSEYEIMVTHYMRVV